MPKVKSYSAAWLAGNAPGRQLFTRDDDSPRSLALTSSKGAIPGPRRTIAKRGTEVFVACGKDIRWGDLASLKEAWASSVPRDARGRSPFRGGIKREESFDESDFENMAGVRVSPTFLGALTRQKHFILTLRHRQSRRDVRKTFDSSLSHPTATISPS